MNDTTMLQLVVYTLAIVEGIKTVVTSWTGKPLDEGIKVIVSVLIGAALAGIVEFAPDTWVRLVPLLTVGLAAAGLYSIGRQSGAAVLAAFNVNKD